MTEFGFFLPMVPPTVTHQQQQVSVWNGRPVVYSPPDLKEARAKFTTLLGRKLEELPERDAIFPMEGPVRLMTKWIWPMGEHGDGEWKITRPDTDNLIKLFKDCMTRTGYWHDDAQVCSEITEKFWGERPGIYVRVEALEQ